MDNQLFLDILMKEEYERTAKVEYDGSPCSQFCKEEDDFIIGSEDIKTNFSEDIKEEKDELDTNSNDGLPFMYFKKGEFDYDHSTLNENELSENSEGLKESLLELLKKENEDDEMYDYYTETASYEFEHNSQQLEDDKSCLTELIKENKMKFETHNSFTESRNLDIGLDSDDYKLPFFDEDFATSFLIQRNLLANNKNYKCHKCGSSLKYYTRLDRGKRRKVLRCKKKGCQTTQSIRRNNSFWSYVDKNGRTISKLSISAQLELVYYWCQDFSANTIAALTGKTNHTVYNWMNMCQEVPLRMFNRRTQFGGPGTVIDIDYCPLASLKAKHYDEQLKSYWVFILCSAYEERYFLLEKKDKTALHKIIKQEISVGSILHSNRWMECKELTKYGYNHRIMNHNENFNGFDTNEDAQKREKLWMPLILFYKCRRNITRKSLSSFLIETWWRSLNKSDIFDGFLRDLAVVF